MEKIKKQNIGVMVLPEDKFLITEAAIFQRRSVASFIVESSLINARKILNKSSVVSE